VLSDLLHIGMVLHFLTTPSIGCTARMLALHCAASETLIDKRSQFTIAVSRKSLA